MAKKARQKISTQGPPRTLPSNVWGLLRRCPYLVAIIAVSLYIVLFQHGLITTGDAWAESYAEYLDESVGYGWSEIFAQNWAGYFSIVPSFIAKVYVYFGLPLGYIDWFYRAVTILFTVLVTSLFALKVNRTLIKSDSLRILLAIATAAILFDVSTFSFINVWYIAFLPILFLYINPQKVSNKIDVVFGVLGGLISLSKPFLIMLPVAIYRAVRSRQWPGPILFAVASAIQTYQIIFNDRRQLVENTDFTFINILNGIFVGSGTALLKLLGIVPLYFWFVIGANIALLVILAMLWRTRGFLITAVLGGVFIYSVYTYVLAPDSAGPHNFSSLYSFDLKSQREIMINGSLTIMFFLLFDSLRKALTRRKNIRFSSYSRYIVLGLAFVLIAVIYKPVDTTSAGVSTRPIDSFRTDLNNHTPTCVPLSPTPIFLESANWSYAFGGICHTPNHDLNLFKPDFTNMTIPANRVFFEVNARHLLLNKDSLVAVVIPVYNKSGDPNTLIITDTNSQKSYTNRVEATKGIQFISFNTRGLKMHDIYKLEISQKKQGLLLGRFKDTRIPIVYTYFLEKRP